MKYLLTLLGLVFVFGICDAQIPDDIKIPGVRGQGQTKTDTSKGKQNAMGFEHRDD